MKKNCGLKRNTTDKFYTKPDIATLCIDHLQKHIIIDKNRDIVIEPSAGNGSFIQDLSDICNDTYFYDLYPNHTGITKQDYLELSTSDITKKALIKDENCKIHVVGNPPFGRQSSLALKFIKKSCKFADTISFILPKSFKKASRHKAFNMRFHLVLDVELPLNSFLLDNNDYSVPCIFQIWEKKDIDREPILLYKPYHYTFVKKLKPHDISFRRVGINAGDIDKETANKSEQSHYFIKFDEKIILSNELLLELKNIDFTCSENTVGPKSISKQELMQQFNTVIPKFSKID